jgi:DNA-directed RNA polymerase specialized sigma subunit
MSTFDNYLEEQYRPAYEAWQADQTPEGNATFLKAVDPIVQKGIKMYGGDSPLVASQGRLAALDAARKYDPTRSRLQSHLLTQMQSLRRTARQQAEVVRTPERVLLESQKLRAYSQEIEDETGREPTDAELSDKLGISLDRLSRIRQYQPGMSTGQADAIDPMQGGVASRRVGNNDAEQMWAQLVYHDLGDVDKKILEYSLGLNGHKKLSNSEIAKKINRSPGSVSQRKLKIQRLLDQEQDLSPFI